MELVEGLIEFLAIYGYLFLFGATALENIPVIGIFLPGEVVVVAAGFAASGGSFDLSAVIIVACLGAITGTITSYALGFWGGRRLIELIAGRFHVSVDRVEVADQYFHTHGPLTVLVGRYATGVKAFIPALAGTHRMKFSKFILFAVIGVVTWTVLAGTLGYLFGQHWDTLIKAMKTFGWGAILLVLMIVLLISRRRQKKT